MQKQYNSISIRHFVCPVNSVSMSSKWSFHVYSFWVSPSIFAFKGDSSNLIVWLVIVALWTLCLSWNFFNNFSGIKLGTLGWGSAVPIFSQSISFNQLYFFFIVLFGCLKFLDRPNQHLNHKYEPVCIQSNGQNDHDGHLCDDCGLINS